MEFIIDNWAVILGIAVLLIILVIGGIAFLKQPREVQLAKVKEWLLYIVTEAERNMGDGTGQLKLRFVYDQFIIRFPQLSKVISFETFSMLVDEALEEMRHMLATNPKVAQIVSEKPSEPVAIIVKE